MSSSVRRPGVTSTLCAILAVMGIAIPGGARDEGVPWGPSAREVLASNSEPEGLNPEYQVKAAFLYKFINYTTWPKDVFPKKSSPFVVEVIGRDPFAGQLGKTFRGKKIDNRRIVVRYSKKVPAAIQGHLVFIGGLSSKACESLIAICRNRPVLLVGERPNLATLGADVNLYLNRGKVRFEINTDVVKSSRLKISSKLLRLARIIRSEGEKS